MADRKKVRFTLNDFAEAEHAAWSADKECQAALDDAEIVKEHGKDLLAAIMSGFAKGKDKISETQLERLARSSDDWKDFREKQFDVMRRAGTLKMKSRSAQRYFDCIQSGLAYRRNEMKRLDT